MIFEGGDVALMEHLLGWPLLGSGVNIRQENPMDKKSTQFRLQPITKKKKRLPIKRKPATTRRTCSVAKLYRLEPGFDTTRLPPEARVTMAAGSCQPRSHLPSSLAPGASCRVRRPSCSISSAKEKETQGSRGPGLGFFLGVGGPKKNKTPLPRKPQNVQGGSGPDYSWDRDSPNAAKQFLVQRGSQKGVPS